ncbi:phage major capsid protein [Tautonia plasticadhaerens]|uniref:Phage capsid family protein n=1 Tax=Tautonia plasticadhaerens TaxID=2527974 RepID=A0A518H260_9BACT|nr:phage major capsid protein [Tautonia plasticadhaerens]QDV34917.1 Phage capsid family protein [Tautonia plasticadhaerens]
MTNDVTTEVKNALNAFEAFKTDLAPKLGKLDAFDEAKFNAIQTDIGKALEQSQKEAARTKALEDQNKALEAKQVEHDKELSDLKTAFNRLPAPGTSEDKSKEAKAQANTLFNQFTRTKSANREDFADFIAQKADANPELKALSVNADPSGGFVVMPELGGIIQTKVWESSPMRQLASVITIGTDSYEVILDNDEAGSGWVGETGSRSTTSTPQLGKLTIPVNELYANPKATQKILDDAGIDMESWLGSKVVDKFARDEATAFISGTGVLKPKGILSYTAGTDIGAQQVEQIVSGSAGAFTIDGLISLQNGLKEPYQAGAVFLMKRSSWGAIMKLKDAENRLYFNLTLDKNAGLETMVLGKKIYFADDMPVAASASLSVAYGDFKRAYQIVDRMGIRVLRDPFTDKPYISFYTTKRVGGAVINFEAYKLLKLSN